MNDLLCAFEKEIVFFHVTTKNDSYCSTKNINACQFKSKKMIYLKMKRSLFDTSTKKVTFNILKKMITSTKKNYSFYVTNFDGIAHPRSVLDL